MPACIACTGRPSVSFQHTSLAASFTAAQLAPSSPDLGVQNHRGLPSGLHSAGDLVLPAVASTGYHCCTRSCTTHGTPLQCRPGSSPVIRLLVSLVFVLLDKASSLVPCKASVSLSLDPAIVVQQSSLAGWMEERLPGQHTRQVGSLLPSFLHV